MKKLLALLLMLALLLPAALAETTMYLSAGPEETHALLAAPDEGAAVLGRYYPGTPLTVLEEEGYWRRVCIGGQTGWLVVNYLSGEPTHMTGPVIPVVNEGSTWVNLRKNATTKSDSLARVETGQQVLVLGETADGWSYVDWRGQRGFMLSRFLAAKPGGGARTDIVGRAGEDYIHCHVADNGQPLYFAAAQAEPAVAYCDVNFDGAKDVVVCTAQDGVNASVEFFVWDGERYVQAAHPGAERLVNYFLYSQEGVVVCLENDGQHRALFDDRLFRWEGTELKLLRRAVSEKWVETAADGEKTTRTTWENTLQVRLWDDPAGNAGGVLLYEAHIPLAEGARSEYERIGLLLGQP